MGKLVVLDGLDGSGKTTQINVLAQKLKNKKISFYVINYPNYDSPAGRLIKHYLNGEISKNLFDVNGFAASIFFASDHYLDYVTNWKSKFNENELIIANRYVSSNAIHQMVKFPKTKWLEFLNWLYDLEFNRLQLPKPNQTIYLDLDPVLSQKLIKKRNKTLGLYSDIHEQNLSYLISCREAATFCVNRFDWKVVRCNENDKIYSIDYIAEKIDHILNF